MKINNLQNILLKIFLIEIKMGNNNPNEIKEKELNKINLFDLKDESSDIIMNNKSNSKKKELIQPKKINLIDNYKSPKIIVGIDFGTAGIGYAYCLCDDVKNIILSKLKGQVDNKVPTEIILDNELKHILAFGNECSIYLDTHHDKNSYQYFKNIKMNLYNKIYRIKSTNGKEEDIEKIISIILSKISNEAINQIERDNGKKFEKDEIKWVVSIPAIWEEKSKQIMIEASKEAGLINENTDLSLFLALEPEVAGIFYFSNLYSKLDEELYDIPYIICDIGAGTVDICTYIKKRVENENLISNELDDFEIIEVYNNDNNLIKEEKEEIFDSILIEEYPPIGDDHGGNYINEEFIKRLIENLFGKETVENIKNNKNKKWKYFEANIEKLKTNFSYVEPHDCILDCRLFYDKNTTKTLNDYINEYNGSHLQYKYKINANHEEDWELIFPSQIFVDITKEVADKISLKLEEVYNNVKKAQIIFTGGGSNNTNLIHYISESINEKNLFLDIKSTYQPEISIIKGTVLFGFQSNIIRKRKAKYTIGVKVQQPWDDNLYKDKGKKEYVELMKRDECTNLFSKFITRNDYILFDQIITKYFYAETKIPKIIFYKTLKDDCKYIDEKDENNNLIIEKFGEVTFDIREGFDIDNRGIKIDMKLGGTCIYTTAKYLINGKQIETIQNFANIQYY